MARRVRDYKAEERRRNELARSRGFDSRAQQRGKIERGEMRALDPRRVSSSKTKANQQRFLEDLYGKGPGEKTYEELIKESFGEHGGKKGLSRAARAKEISIAATYDVAKLDRKGDSDIAVSKREWIKKHSVAEYNRIYEAAFIDEDYDAKVIWLHDITGVYSMDEVEQRYGQQRAA